MGVRLAAIDVGSNAIRLTIGELEKNGINIIENYRVPLRLGRDTFSKNSIQDSTVKALLRAFVEFQHHFIKHKVKYYKAAATSAFRDAKNKEELLDLIYSTSHIQLDIIDGREEARLIHLAVSHTENISNKNALLIDIGGGSVEFIISIDGKIKKFFSLNMGTVRLLQKCNREKPLNLKRYLRNEIRKTLDPILRYKNYFNTLNDKKVLIGTGGNLKSLNKLSSSLFKDSGKESIKYLEIELMEKILFGYTMQERMTQLDLKKDRADVILPAVLVIEEVMRSFSFKSIKTPNIALKDGILIQLSKNH